MIEDKRDFGIEKRSDNVKNESSQILGNNKKCPFNLFRIGCDLSRTLFGFLLDL